MRKIEVTRKKFGAGIGGQHFTDYECKQLFGELPGEFPGETRSYYIIPAGDVAEFEIGSLKDMPSGSSGFISRDVKNGARKWIPTMSVNQLFGVELKDDETRRVTAIVHPPDEPKEDTVKEKPTKFRKFRVTNGEKDGDCYLVSYHFDIYWDDGTCDTDVCDLSYIGAKKTFEEEAIPAKQPIILKRNNTPTREGNYFSAEHGGTNPHYRTVRMLDGRLRFYDEFTTRREVVDHYWWSDELGLIEFEAEPEPPPKPRCGWFEDNGTIHRVMQLLKASAPRVVVDPPFREATYSFVSDIESKGITVHWYGDDA